MIIILTSFACAVFAILFYFRKIEEPSKVLSKDPLATMTDMDWKVASMNPHRVPLLEAHPEKIYWSWLSLNPGAIHLLEKNPDKINWMYLSSNPGAIELLEKNIDKINWTFILGNRNATKLIIEHQDKINWAEAKFYSLPNKIATD